MVKIPIDRLEEVGGYYENLLVESLSEIERVKDVTEKEEQEDSPARKYLDKVSISEIGKEISSLYQRLEKLGNEEALLGFKQLVVDLAQDVDKKETVNFLKTAKKLATEDIQSYEYLFVLANRLYAADYNTRAWLSTLNNLTVAEQKQFMQLSDWIISAEDDELEARLWESFMDTTKLALRADQQERNLLKQLFTELRSQLSLFEMEGFLENFREEISS
ncbi:hypothetical protein [Fuchsiella alkaliacetigena]|uniref:hypothetical protein n=1 Tax=Fuchsiella alkaliacetigena TaxID=957042 RepID=UPI00200B2224|nr:hypothetical protein [Fuchsiella alkaliacetigena]MCK8823971.1 hypothetical protein [Fuchsiella alkaliacetigena]